MRRNGSKTSIPPQNTIYYRCYNYLFFVKHLKFCGKTVITGLQFRIFIIRLQLGMTGVGTV